MYSTHPWKQQIQKDYNQNQHPVIWIVFKWSKHTFTSYIIIDPELMQIPKEDSIQPTCIVKSWLLMTWDPFYKGYQHG